MVVGGIEDPAAVDLDPVGLTNVGLGRGLDAVNLELAGSLVQREHPVARLDLLDRDHPPIDGVDPYVPSEAFVLGGDAGEVLALGLGNPQLLVGRLDRLGNHVPVLGLTTRRLDVVVDVVEVDVVERAAATPLRDRLAKEPLVGLEPESRASTCGSFFISDIWRMIDSLRPLAGLNSLSSTSCQPSL